MFIRSCLVFALALTPLKSAHSEELSQECVDIPDALQSLIANKPMLVFGELHGTQEMPQQFANAVCHALKVHLEVVVALEWPESLQRHANQYLTTQNISFAGSDISSHPFWSRPLQYGSSSQAMLGLLDTFKQWNTSHQRVHVVAFDKEFGKRETDNDLATGIQRGLAQHSGKPMFVLTGNYHSQTIGGTPFGP